MGRSRLSDIPGMIYLLTPKELMPHPLYRLYWNARSALHPRPDGRARVIVYFCEQPPDRESRVLLGAARDALGQPRVELRWRIGPEVTRSVLALQERLATTLRAAGIGELERGEGEPRYTDASHHMGTTRMSRDPRTGVADPTAGSTASTTSTWRGAPSFRRPATRTLRPPSSPWRSGSRTTCAGREHGWLTVAGVQLLHDAERLHRGLVPAEVGGPLEPSAYQVGPELGLGDHPQDRLRQRRVVAGLDQQRRSAGDLRNGPGGRGDHRAAASHRLDLRQAEGLVQRGVDEAVGQVVEQAPARRAGCDRSASAGRRSPAPR